MRRLMPVLRVLIAFLFVYSGGTKLLGAPQTFQAVIEGYKIFPPPAAALLARTVPWAEFLGGLYLAAGLWSGIALGALWLLNSAFILLVLSALARGLPIQHCGCFGEGIDLSLPQVLGLDLILWVVFLSLFAFRKSAFSASLDRRFFNR